MDSGFGEQGTPRRPDAVHGGKRWDEAQRREWKEERELAQELFFRGDWDLEQFSARFKRIYSLIDEKVTGTNQVSSPGT